MISNGGSEGGSEVGRNASEMFVYVRGWKWGRICRYDGMAWDLALIFLDCFFFPSWPFICYFSWLSQSVLGGFLSSYSFASRRCRDRVDDAMWLEGWS